MKRLVVSILALLLAGCQTNQPVEQNEKWPRFIQYVHGDGYVYELFERKDGSRYLEHDGRQIDLSEK